MCARLSSHTRLGGYPAFLTTLFDLAGTFSEQEVIDALPASLGVVCIVGSASLPATVQVAFGAQLGEAEPEDVLEGDPHTLHDFVRVDVCLVLFLFVRFVWSM